MNTIEKEAETKYTEEELQLFFDFCNKDAQVNGGESHFYLDVEQTACEVVMDKLKVSGDDRHYFDVEDHEDLWQDTILEVGADCLKRASAEVEQSTSEFNRHYEWFAEWLAEWKLERNQKNA